MATRFKTTGLFNWSVFTLIIFAMLLPPAFSLAAYASNIDPTNLLKHYLGEVVNTGKDNGYSESNSIDIKDPHYGWRLGRFFVSGYTRISEDTNHNPVFIKTIGDKVTLCLTSNRESTV